MSKFNPHLAGVGEMNVWDLAFSVAVSDPDLAVEDDKLEWKSDWNFSTRPKVASLARHIIAFANRDPDSARREWGGHAFILIGVEPGNVVGTTPIDPADITNKLLPFVGEDLSWHPVYTKIDDAAVLVIVVDPPEWGDPVHAFKRASEDTSGKAIAKGAVYVRRNGVSSPASDSDRARLELRANTARPRLAISTDWNLGESGDYLGVVIHNGSSGRSARITQVGFTLPGDYAVSTDRRSARREFGPNVTREFCSFPISREEVSVEPGDTERWRVPLGPYPFLWEENVLHPYAFYDDGKWLVGEPFPFESKLRGEGWRPSPEQPPLCPEVLTEVNYPIEKRGDVSRVVFPSEALIGGVPNSRGLTSRILRGLLAKLKRGG